MWSLDVSCEVKAVCCGLQGTILRAAGVSASIWILILLTTSTNANPGNTQVMMAEVLGSLPSSWESQIQLLAPASVLPKTGRSGIWENELEDETSVSMPFKEASRKKNVFKLSCCLNLSCSCQLYLNKLASTIPSSFNLWPSQLSPLKKM